MSKRVADLTPEELERRRANDRARRAANREQRNARRRLLRAANREQAREKDRAWRAKNKDRISAQNKARYQANRAEVKAYNKRYRDANIERCRALTKAWQANNVERVKRYRIKNAQLRSVKKKAWREANRERLRAQRKAWREANREDILLRRCVRLQFDEQVRLAARLRIRVCHALRGERRAGSAVRDLGCTIPEFKAHIEAQFLPGMTWDNWGRGDGCWHLDHFIPLAAFDLTDREQFLTACHFSNYRPMWASENISKGASLQPWLDFICEDA